MKERCTFFQFLTITVLVIFMGIMGIVTMAAYYRPSGSTMVSMQQIRVENLRK